MYVLHDIRLVYENRVAQIDFIVITRKVTYVIECKNLIGDIEIDENGNFIRNYEMYGKRIREGLYSPITQNERHLQMIFDIFSNAQGSRLKQHAFERSFFENYKSLVVLANPRSCISNASRNKAISEQVIRADQLITTLKKVNQISKNKVMNQHGCITIAENFLKLHVPDPATKPQDIVVSPYPTVSPKQDQVMLCPRCGGKLVLRTAKKGQYSGNSFYGCSNYPKCKFILNVK